MKRKLIAIILMAAIIAGTIGLPTMGINQAIADDSGGPVGGLNIVGEDPMPSSELPQPLKLNANQIYAYDYSGNGKKLTSACSLTFTDTTAATAYALVSNSISKVATSKKKVCTVAIYSVPDVIVKGRTQKVVVLTAKKKGTARVTLKDSKGNVQFTFNIKVTKTPKSEVKTVELKPYDTTQKSFTIANAKKAVTTASSICKATVKNGKVTVKCYAPGTAVVYVKNKNGKVIADIIVTVKPLKISTDITNSKSGAAYKEVFRGEIPRVLRSITHVGVNKAGEGIILGGKLYENGKESALYPAFPLYKDPEDMTSFTEYLDIKYYVNGKTVRYFQKAGTVTLVTTGGAR